MRILYVEDDLVVATIMKRIIEKDGHEVILKYNGVQGLETFKNDGPFDCVISNLMMSEMDGKTMIHAIKSIVPNMKFIITTAGDGTNHCDKCKILWKPVEKSKVLKILEDLVNLINREGSISL